ncbi:MAG: polyphosphate kinase 1 [Candidatus Dormibacteraeota bacterium]|nr:polyphosphate kinase 1 [Candidatus Dormibacteraeota bacterium]
MTAIAAAVPTPKAKTSTLGSSTEIRPLPQDRFFNRELSRLEFDSRVLSMAEDHARPLAERIRFLAILSDSLDDFFQVRVSGLHEQLMAPVRLTSPDGMSPEEQLAGIRHRVLDLIERQSTAFSREIVPALAEAGFRLVNAEDLSKADRKLLADVFQERIFPVLTPLAVDPAHPFPYISNLSLNLAVMVRDPMRQEPRFARVKVPPLLPRFIGLPDGERFVPLEQVIALHLPVLFPGMEIASHHLFRVTRDADLDLDDDEAEDLMVAVQAELMRKRRKGRAVRLEADPGMSPDVLLLLLRELDLSNQDVYSVTGMLDLTTLTSIQMPDGNLPAASSWMPATQPRLRPHNGEAVDIFEVIRNGDVLVHHPYDSFVTSVEAFVEQAAADKDVLAIKVAMYRTSGPDSPIARALKNAAQSGKQVVALVELKARGDEQANIVWAKALEAAGIHVVYGLVGLKTHAKLMLVVRQEGAGVRRYVHIGTGNYNAATAGLFEDVALFTADLDVTADIAELFNYLTGYSRQSKYRKLLVAPTTLRAGMLTLIQQEASKPDGRIVIKVNNLVDPDVIDALYEASQAGTRIDLIVRGICCLKPGVAGLSEGIRVRSLVGHHLEHSRIFRFGVDDGSHVLIGSSDLMPRNLDRRVEAVVPVADPNCKREIEQFLELELADDTLAWELAGDGTWRKVATGDDQPGQPGPRSGAGVNTQVRMQRATLGIVDGERVRA